MSNWSPSYSDIEWTKNLITSLKDKGTWLVPVSKSSWTFDKSALKATLNFGDPKDETNIRIRTVLEEYLGYTVSTA